MTRNLTLASKLGPIAKALLFVLPLISPTVVLADSRASDPSTDMADAAAPKLIAQWIGGPTLRLQFGPIFIVTDPVLGETFRMIDPNTGQADAEHVRLRSDPDLESLDAEFVLLSHDHPDHFDDAAFAFYGNHAHFLVPASQAGGLKQRGIERVDQLAWSQTREIEKNGFRVLITALPAQHSERAELTNILGDVNAYWLEFRAGEYSRSLFWTGDSFFIPSLSTWPAKPDLFVPHLGAVGAGGPFGQVSMNAHQALEFGRMVSPKAVLPIHHSTFSLYREPISEFVVVAEEQPWDLLVIKEGESIEID